MLTVNKDKLLSKSKISLMSRKDSVFICTILFSLKFSWSKDLPTAGTDGENLIINPDFFLGLTPAERVGLLAHEAWHVAWDHMYRSTGYDKKKYNKAADHVINIMLLTQGYSLPPDGLHDFAYEGLSTEKVYALLPDSPDDGTEDSYDYDILENPAKAGIADKQGRVQQIIIKAATQSRLQGDSFGSLPGNIRKYIDKLINPKLPWYTILQNYIASYAKEDYSFRRPNKKFMPDFYLPSLYSENITGLGIALDISASVSKQEFTTYITEVASIKDTLKPLTTDVLTFDTQISEIHTLGLDDSVEDIEFVGGGGTDLHPVFNYFNNNSPTVLIVFSDLECAPIMDTPEYDVIWIIVNNPTAKTNFGIDIHYSTKDL